MMVYRIALEKHIHDLSGSGARAYGGRWNRKGTPVIYASETRTLAAFEYLVHISLSLIPRKLSIATIEIGKRTKPRTIGSEDLPPQWRDFPSPLELADIGSKWVSANGSLLLRVPSAVIPNEFNVLINPLHPDIRHVSVTDIAPFQFDPRLL